MTNLFDYLYFKVARNILRPTSPSRASQDDFGIGISG